MAWHLLEPAMAALVAATAFFVLLGILILFIEDLDIKIVLGSIFILVGVAIALFAIGLPEITLFFIGIIAAMVVSEVIEYFSLF